MSKTVKVIVLLALALGVMQAAVASDPPKGAKALFGQGNEEVFYPRQQGAGGSAAMNPTSQVSDEMLTSFYKKPDFPGLAYSLEVIRAGENTVRTVEDPRKYEFKTGDRVRVRLVPNFTGHAYVMESKQGSASQLIYPATFGTMENQVIAGRETYVPSHGWLRLTDPPGPFTMKVLFKPGADYQLNQPAPNPAAARVALASAVDRQWQKTRGSKGLVFESDKSYVNASATGSAAPPAAKAPQPNSPPPAQGQAVPAVSRSNYTTNYVVNTAAPTAPGTEDESAIAIEVLIRHVGK